MIVIWAREGRGRKKFEIFLILAQDLLFSLLSCSVLNVTQTAGDAEPHPGHYLAPSRSADQPEGHPGARHDDDQREVGPQARYSHTHHKTYMIQGVPIKSSP